METVNNEEISLKKIIIAGIHHWRLFVLAGIVSIIPAGLYLLLYPKTYEITSIIKLQEDKDLGSGSSMGLGEASGLMKSFGLMSKGSGTINIDDEIAVFQSNKLLKEVIWELGLDVSYQKPFSLLRLYHDNTPILVIPDSLMRSTLEEDIAFSLKVNKNGSVEIEMEETGEKYKFPHLPVNLPSEKGTIQIVQNNNIESKNKNISLNITITPASWVAEDLVEEISLDVYTESSNSLEFLYEDHNPIRGKELLTSLANKYNKFTEAIKQKEGQESMLFLDKRINDVVTQLQIKEQKIERYKLENKMMDIQYDVQFYIEAVKAYREKIIELESQRHLIVLINNYVTDPKNKYNIIPSILSSGTGENGGAISLYNEALITREKLIKSSGSINPLSEVADNQLDKLREGVIVSIENIKKSVDIVITDLKSKEKEILDKMGNVPVYEREYIDLKRQQEILQGVYLVLLQKKEEIALSLGGNRDRGLITEPAYVKHRPVAPRKLFAAIFMILFTAVIPVGYLFGKKQIKELIKEYKASK